MVGWMCFTSNGQRDHLETASTFTAPCKGREARFFTPFPPGIELRSSLSSPLQYRCTTPAPHTSRTCDLPQKVKCSQKIGTWSSIPSAFMK